MGLWSTIQGWFSRKPKNPPPHDPFSQPAPAPPNHPQDAIFPSPPQDPAFPPPPGDPAFPAPTPVPLSPDPMGAVPPEPFDPFGNPPAPPPQPHPQPGTPVHPASPPPPDPAINQPLPPVPTSDPFAPPRPDEPLPGEPTTSPLDPFGGQADPSPSPPPMPVAPPPPITVTPDAPAPEPVSIDISFGAALSREKFNEVAQRLGVNAAEIFAVLSVETKGFGYQKNMLPLILFERHLFSRHTDRRFDASHPDISHRKWGGWGPSSQQYSRLTRAAALDFDAALKSASWGLGQVLGQNAENLDYPDVRIFVERMRASEDEQLEAFMRFIIVNNIKDDMQRHDWAGFAKTYNGSAFKKNKYDTRLANAFRKYSNPAKQPDLDVRAAQIYLGYLGHDPRGVDGFMGRMTRDALHQYFQVHNLEIDTQILNEIPVEVLELLKSDVRKLVPDWPLDHIPMA